MLPLACGTEMGDLGNHGLSPTRPRRSWAGTLALAVCAVVSTGQTGPARGEDAPTMITVTPRDATFTTIPDMPSCATGAVVRGDPRSGPAWVLLKLASGCRVPWHWHTANEDLVIIGGQGTLEMQDGPALPFTPGAYASLPSRHTHQARCTRSCLLFSIADAAFDIHYVDATGRAISAHDALRAAPKATKR